MRMASLYIQLQQYELLQLARLSESNSPSIPAENIGADCCTLLIALDRGVRLHINNIAQDLRQGSCILLLPQQTFCLEGTCEQARVIRFTFQAFEVEGLVLRHVASPPLIPSYPYSLPFSTLKSVLGNEDLASFQPVQSSPVPPPLLAILQARLQLVLGMMAQLEQTSSSPVHNEKAVQRTLSYIEQHYNEDLTVEQLAEMAGMVRWKYSKLFKAIAGKKPTDYITELRVKHAKRMLISSTEPLREISRQVGFKDEYYFSRRFQQLTGSPPREYANTQLRSRRRTVTDSLGRQIRLPEVTTRVVATGTNTLGELLALGICPVGAGIATMKSQVIYRNRLQNISDIGLRAAPEQVSPLKPDLMLLGNYCEQQLPELDAIAPTIVYYETNSTYERLRYIASLFDRDKAAEQWINRYENRMRQIRRQLEDQYAAGEYATVYLLLGTNVYVMGKTGFAATLYEALGFRPSLPVHRLIEDKKPWIQIRHNEIRHYTAGRNFVLVPKEEMQLNAPSPLLTLVLNLAPSKVHVVEASWNYDDPITRERLLTVLPSILAKKQHAVVQV
ncbi:helix-turn-helix domain-containing protein [Paenibacillus taichungensis]|uniref:Helix-turn-helix domain-containing protein n=1 Tax=Paenibacillus taichungensis TaxID=484184 RepID=A0ABX2MNS7_9BACL|nr:helix-turn-helix domain-containing protein [Paenibacillus taichungensis]NUU55692.1 helix-turn-helix domain-containing protein [Paenibacillus taichungensis]